MIRMIMTGFSNPILRCHNNLTPAHRRLTGTANQDALGQSYLMSSQRRHIRVNLSAYHTFLRACRLARHMDLLYDIVDHDLDQYSTTYENDGDDKFYAELERRILVLINTADESDHSKNSRMMRRTNNYSSHRDKSYFDWTETENPPSSVPSTILNLWRSNVNGTGVFIPHMVKAKRRNKNRGRKVRTEREIYKAKEVANKN